MLRNTDNFMSRNCVAILNSILTTMHIVWLGIKMRKIPSTAFKIYLTFKFDKDTVFPGIGGY